MIINTNIQALLCFKAIRDSGNAISKASDKLSSGSKLNSSGDNPGKFALSKKMQAQLKSLEMADRNANDAVSLAQTAEGGMNEIQSIIIRMRELAVQGATDILTDEDRSKIKIEIDELKEHIDFISDTCAFNGKNLLNGTYESLTFQTNTFDGGSIELEILDTTTESLGIKDMDYETMEGCDEAIELCDKALDIISEYRAIYGAFQNRLDYVIDSLNISSLNITEALSDIQDTDMSREMLEYSTQNVLMQAGLSMLAQANQRPDELLSLLR